MKTWGWIALLLISCVLAAASVVLMMELLGLSFKNADTPPESTIITFDDPELNQRLNTQTSTIEPSKAGNISDSKNSLAENLIENASFEQDPLMASPIWQVTGFGNDSIVEWTHERAASGSYALKISAMQPSNRGWPGWVMKLPFQANHSYQLQVSYYTPDGANAWLEVAFLDDENRLLKGFSTGCPRVSVLGQWTAIRYRVKAEWAPQGSRSIRIGLRQCLNHTKGRRTTLYFDDISLSSIPKSQ
jgi:hypothetical protein